MLGFGALGQYALGEVSEGVTETVQYGKWVTLWGEPVRYPARLNAALNKFDYFQIASFPEDVTESRWHQPWSEPKQVRGAAQRPEFEVALQQVTAFVDWAKSNDQFWFSPLSEPKRFKPRTAAYEQPYYAHLPDQDDFDFRGWFVQLSEPRRYPKGLRPDLQSTTVISQQSYSTPRSYGYVIC